MSRPVLFLLALMLATVAAEARAQGYTPAADRVIAQARKAAGGAAWYRLRGWHETGREGGVAYESWIDPVRYGLRLETRDGAGVHVEGFNGQAVWRILPGGATTAVNDHSALAQARTTAFFAAACYYYPGRFDVRGDYRGVRTFSGRAFDVVEVQPWGAQARELWFDRRTHLLGRIVDRSGGRWSALAVSDYRRVGPVLVPFRYTAEAGAGAAVQSRQIATLAFTPSERDLFSLATPALVSKAVPGSSLEAAREPAAAVRRP